MFSFLKKFSIGDKLRSLIGKKVDEEELEELFYQSDLGSELTSELLKKVDHVRGKSTDEVIDVIKKTLIDQLNLIQPKQAAASPCVILIVGVNGNGKTTSVAKLAHHYKNSGKSVILAAADTYRAAATQQLEMWAKKIDCPIVKGQSKSDPASIVFDAIDAAKHRECDYVIIDTAGRLHTKTDLMQELNKIYRVSSKALPGAPHEILLVLDATIGQNGIEQAATFQKFTPLTGLILTKMDGTAKGGIALTIQKKLNLPIRFIGTGEQIDDLKPFDSEAFVASLFA